MKKLILSILLAGSFMSCRKLDQPITKEFTETAFWRNSQDALDALTACYEHLSKADYYFGDEALSDNAYNAGTGQLNVNAISNGGYDAANARVADTWSYYYLTIRRCNNVTNNIDRVPNMDVLLKARILAEARFIRAYAYFQLTAWYGDVPYYTNLISIDESRTIARTDKNTIQDFVLAELAAIEKDLPTNVQQAQNDRGRITRGAAIALSARVHLFRSEWAAVVTDCEKLIGKTENGTYALFPNYRNLFTVANEYNSEVILDLQYGGGRTHDKQRSFMPQTVAALRSVLVPTQDLVNDYIMTNGKGINETGSGYNESNPYINRDPRFEATILHHGSKVIDFTGAEQTILTQPGSVPTTNTVDDQGASPTGYYFYKHYDRAATNYASGLNLIMIRYADVLLMYAEAKNELTQMNATVWGQTIQLIRTRAGFTDAGALQFDAALNQSQLREVIRRDRRAELAFEGGRIYDIRRWKTADVVLNKPVRGIKVTSGAFNKDANGYIIVENRQFTNPKHYLWPVPTVERDQNKNLSQNKDW
ncbi:RagB/SusD family nutrient uptake outer membrane protein [Chitinophaga sp. sic0106]|uniref:RagB/SusD family nutrient uptake outer membrane protein n=1 Tax=Chitinophaga sp. sic0106 TaxID=2854785 RepID=UPI001C486520|nr:RagB/SusD family nutrient uptake outer membrane protein [Chitinophaga sp. sic0106]MBV7530615.1 RagB/SusD family nutrient uptake outer membrane protein [Chitinophaga sp. sic0106]